MGGYLKTPCAKHDKEFRDYVQLREQSAQETDAQKLADLRSKAKALIDAAKPFCVNVHHLYRDDETMSWRHSAKHYRTMYAALKSIEGTFP